MSNNPYSAILTAIPLGDEFLTEKGAVASDVWEAVLNIGLDDGIEVGSIFLVFSLGPEIKDPVSGESLGSFEIVRGRGKVTHLQQKMCTIRSTKTITQRTPVGGLFGATRSIDGSAPKYEFREKAAPFSMLAVGDFARLVA